jgi:Rrf2 family protein
MRDTEDMRLSARVDYALRATVELAAGEAGPVTAVQLAEAQHIPPKFLENILSQLRRSGLIRSQRGPDGGYWLSKPPEAITMADVIRAVDGPLLGVRGERPEHVDYEGAAKSLQEVWIALRASERSILEQVTLAHVAGGKLPPSIASLVEDPKAWD